MTVLLMLTGLLLPSVQATASAPPAEAQPSNRLVQTVNLRGMRSCMGAMVGFRNVPLRCVVAADGTLSDCEVHSTNRAVLRYSRVYRCMASNVRVAAPDGTIPVGDTIAYRINGLSFMSGPID